MELIAYVQARMTEALMTGAKTIVVPAELFNNASESQQQAAQGLCRVAGCQMVLKKWWLFWK